MNADEATALINGPTGFAREMHVSTVEELMRRGTLSRFDKGAFVTRRGQNLPRLCIALSGLVRLTAFTEDGREMLTHIIQPGDCWGVHPCLGGFQETNDSVVEVTGQILTLRPEVVEDLMWTRQDFQKALVALLCHRLNLAVSLAEQFGAWSARERVAWRLLLLANANRPSGATQAEQLMLRITTSQETLAAMVHLSRQRTNVILKAMQKDGLLALKYGAIEILDPDALKAETSRAR